MSTSSKSSIKEPVRTPTDLFCAQHPDRIAGLAICCLRLPVFEVSPKPDLLEWLQWSRLTSTDGAGGKGTWGKLLDTDAGQDFLTKHVTDGAGGKGTWGKLLDTDADPCLDRNDPNYDSGEVEVLSCIRHPNMVLLLGACPQYGCLVYEYMDNGSLDDRLFRRCDTPIPWSIRFKIAAEIAT